MSCQRGNVCVSKRLDSHNNLSGGFSRLSALLTVLFLGIAGLGLPLGWKLFFSPSPAHAQELAVENSQTLEEISRIFTVNIPSAFKEAVTMAALTLEGESIFGGPVTFQNDTVFDGTLRIGGSIFADGAALNLGNGTITASNIIYSLTEGDGIDISTGQTPTITNSDRGSSQNIFKKVKLGDSTAEADGNSDTLEFSAGDGISLSIDTDNDKLTITNSTSPGLVKSGTYAVFTSGVTRVGLGTSNPSNTLEVDSGTNGESGITFTRITSSSAAGVGGGKVLSVDSGGKIILVEDQTGGDGATPSAEAVLPTATNGMTLYFNGTNWVASDNLFHDGGSVGISNTSPTSRFHINTNLASKIGLIVQGYSSQTANLQEWRNSSGSILSYIDSNGVFNGSANVEGTLDPGLTTGSVLFQSASGITDDNSNFYWDNSNNRLGLGTNSPSTQLHTYNGSSAVENGITIDGTGYQFLKINRPSTSRYAQTSYQTAGTNIWSTGLHDDSTNTFHLWDAGGNKFLSVTDQGTTGFVGINTISPIRPLQIARSDSTAYSGGIANTAEQVIQNTNTTNNTFSSLAFSSVDSGGSYLQASRIASIVTDHTDSAETSALTFATTIAGSFDERMRIHSDGNIGIGDTTPGAMLEINTRAANVKGLIVKAFSSQSSNLQEWQDSSGSILARVNQSGQLYAPYGEFVTTSGSIPALVVRGVSNQTANIFRIQKSDSVDQFIVDANGNIGIGASTATSKLHVEAPTGAALTRLNQTGTGDILTASASGTTRLVLTQAGILGVGTASPNTDMKFQVDGKSYFSQSVHIDYGHDQLGANTDGGLVFRSAAGMSGTLNAWMGSYFDSDGVKLAVHSGADRAFLLTDYGNTSRQHDVATQTNPTFFVFSATNPDTENTQWLSLTHDQTNGLITTGKGALNFAPATGVAEMAVSQNAANNLIVRNSQGGTAARSIVSVLGDAAVGLNLHAFGSGYTTSGFFQANRQVIDGNGSGGLFIGSQHASGVVAFYTAGLSTTNERMRIDADGDVGIGTTNPGYKLEVNGTSYFGSQARFNGALFLHSNTSTTFFGSANQEALSFRNSSSTDGAWTSLSFQDASANEVAAIGLKVTDQTNHYAALAFGTKGTDGKTTRMYIAPEGNVGIGTTTTTYRLNVYSASTGTQAEFRNDSGNVSYISITDNSTGAGQSNGLTVGYNNGGMVMNREATALSLGTTDTTRLHITAAGMVGIGTTAPSSKLHVDGASGNSLAFLTQTGTGDILTASSSGTTRMVLTSNGTLGLGVAVPETSVKFQVAGSTLIHNNNFHFGFKNGNSTSHRMIGINSSDQLQIGEASNGVPIYLRTSSSGSIYLDTSGNVGIGTTTFGTGAAKVLSIAGSTAPSTAITDGAQLFAVDQGGSHELRVMDEAGNTTTLSPHNFALIGNRSEDMAWSFYSERNALAINADMTKALRLVEKLSGEKLVYLKNLETAEVLEDESDATRVTELADNGTIGEIARWSYELWTFVGEVTFEKPARFLKNTTFLADLSISGRIVHKNRDTAGIAVIKTGATSISVTFDTPYEQRPIVTLTPEGKVPAYFLENVTKDGFTITLSETSTQDSVLSWSVTAVEELRRDESSTTTSAQTPSPSPTTSPSPSIQPPPSSEASPAPSTTPQPSDSTSSGELTTP